jgi:hypothetical protein
MPPGFRRLAADTSARRKFAANKGNSAPLALAVEVSRMAEPASYGNRRIIKVTPGNLRQHHLYTGEHLDFFPAG